jgi:sodium-dependent dicarboxylate transporter 2/3/5
MKNHTKIIIALVLAIVAFGLMSIFFNTTQSLLIATIVLLVTLWSNDGLPLAVVSLLPIVLFPAFGILTTKETTINYAHPIIYLFLGGFLIAIGVEKTGLHKIIANKMLSIFPSSARGIIFALIITSGLLSSVLSNTTTALLLLPIALFLSDEAKIKMRLALAIAYGASIGGILTPIGTPPNLILMGVMQEYGLETMAFAKWMYMVAPVVLVMFIVVGFVLSYGLKDYKLEVKLEQSTLNVEQKKVLFVLFSLIILLLLNAPIKPYYSGLGLSEPAILLAFGLVLFMPPFDILDWMGDKDHIPYRIMFLFGAGFAIAKAFSATHMADEIARKLIFFSDMPFILFLVLLATLVTFTTEITSNTALISIMLPILYKVAIQTGMDAKLVMMVATICASYAFMLPIATPPNAIAMSSGVISIKTMAKYGFILNLIGIIVIVTIAKLFWVDAIGF